MSDHARLSPSNKRWPHCAGSVREEANFPDTPGRAAIDGTGTHLLLELCIQNGESPYDYIEQTIGADHEDMPLGWVIDRERSDRVQMALDYIERRKRELGDEFPDCTIEVSSESKSDPGGRFSPPRTDWWGTADITFRVVRADGHLSYLEVADYKDGRGWVSAEDNSQLQSYAAGKLPAGAVAMSTVRGVRMTVIQPRTSPVIRYADSSAGAVHAESVRLKEAADLTDPIDAPLVAGWWCQWCKANPKNGGHCTQPVKQATQEVQMSTDTETGLSGLLDLDVTAASEEQLAAIMDQKPMIDAAFERVEQEIGSRLEQELDVPGWAIKPGKRSRSWVDEQQVLGALKTTSLKMDEYAPRKLISPAQAEKVVSKRTFKSKIESLIEVTAGKSKPRRVSQSKPKEDIFKGVTPSFL